MRRRAGRRRRHHGLYRLRSALRRKKDLERSNATVVVNQVNKAVESVEDFSAPFQLVAASVVVSIFPYKNPTASREDVLEAITVLDALGKRLVRILGIKHPKTFNVQAAAYQARQKLAAMEPPRRATLEDALAAFDL